MKLSEAIREGAKLRPQAFGGLYKDNKSCAIGAAMEGAGFWKYDNDHSYNMRELEDKFDVSHAFIDEVLEMNDHELLTREEIADILELRGY